MSLTVNRGGYVDLVLSIAGSEDRITIEEGVNAEYNRIEQFRFADGSVKSLADIKARVTRLSGIMASGKVISGILSSAADETLDASAHTAGTFLNGDGGYDTLIGSKFADILIGGLGNDNLDGGGGADVYRFSAGFGQDVILELVEDGTNNVIEFDSSLIASNLIIEANVETGDDGSINFGKGRIRFSGADDRISFSDLDVLSEIRFADGMVLGRRQIADRAIPNQTVDRQANDLEKTSADGVNGTDADDYINGRDGEDVLTGGAGNDTLEGNGGADVLIGGTGSDVLSGGAGGDIYRFSRGDGEDRISDFVEEIAVNIVKFDATVEQAKVSVLTENADLTGTFYLSVAGSEDRIWIQRSERDPVISEFHFADGTVWKATDIEARLTYAQKPTITSSVNGTRMVGTAGSDVLTGTAGPDDIVGHSAVEWKPVGDNLLVNGSFEQWASNAVAGKGGYRATTLPGWIRLSGAEANSFLGVEIKASSYADVVTLDGGYWLDLDGKDDGIRDGDPRSNLHIAQDISDLQLGEILMVSFDSSRGNNTTSASFDVLWNGEVVAAVNRTFRAMERSSILLAAQQGKNRLEFRGTGYPDDYGAALDNVVLMRVTSAPSNMNGDDQLSGLGGDDIIRGDNGNDVISGGSGNDLLAGFGGRDTITGDSGNDDLSGGAGDDELFGGDGNDVYRFSKGDGQDKISDEAGDDRILFAAGITEGNVVVRLSSDFTTLVVTFTDSADRITISNGLADDGRAIESFVFADGVTWSLAQIQERARAATPNNDFIRGSLRSEILTGGAGDDHVLSQGNGDTLVGGPGNDILTGAEGADILIGGTGDDRLLGGDGNDVYRWGRGEGNDTIFDTGGIDRVELLRGITPDEIKVTAVDALTLVLQIRDTGEQLTLSKVLSTSANVIENIDFADGTIWSAPELRNQSFIGSKATDTIVGTTNADRIDGRGGNDRLDGDNGDDILLGGDGNDVLNGGGGADRLIGGPGDDRQTGGKGADTYVFAAGDGVDSIIDQGDDSINILRIEGYGLNAIRFGAQGRDLVIRFAGSTDRIIVLNTLGDSEADRIGAFEIVDDATTLSLTDIVTRLVDDVAVTGQWLVGGLGADVLVGGGGDDYLKGGAGADILSGGAGDDHFADVSADDAVDSLTGGIGRDIYYYLPVRDDGVTVVADVITDFAAGADGDIIRLSSSNPNPFEGGGILLAQLGSDTLVIRRSAAGPDQVLVRLLNVDATALTPANFDGLPIAIDNSISINDDDADHILNGSTLDDRIYGNGGADTISGFNGNDRLAGGADNDVIDGGLGNDLIAGQDGNDRIIGGAGSDVISGGSGDDIIIGYGDGSQPTDVDVFEGGTGDDKLYGGAGTDIYRFARGDGRDTIIDLGGTDRIEFATGISAADISVGQIGRDIELRIANDGGRIRVTGALNGTATIETIVFADGSAWDWSEVLSRSTITSAGDDTITLPVAFGRDLIVNGDFSQFLPADVLGYTGTSVRLRSVAGWTEANRRDFEYQTDSEGYWLDMEEFYAHMDIHQALNGLTAGQQLALQFDYKRPDGAPTSGLSVFWNGVSLTAMTVDNGEWQTATIFVTAAEGANALRFLSSGASSTAGVGLDNVHLYVVGSQPGGTLLGKAGNDTLQGGSGNDTLSGGTGGDLLIGATGDDTYLFARGDGQDAIRDTDGVNTLSFAAGILPAEVRVVSGPTNLVLEIIGTGDRIDLGTPARAGMGVSRVVFADGTIWNEATLIAMARAPTNGDDIIRGDELDNVLSGGAGDDLLVGNEGADTLDGGPGNDLLEGGAGDDTYLFGANGGHDRISDTGGNDTLVLAVGIGPSDIAVAQSRDGADFTLIVKATGARVTIENALTTGKIKTIRFADDTTWTTDELIARASSFADDVLTGDAGANVMIGGLGNDHLSGRAGNDTYRFARGDGSDVIDDKSSSAADRLEITGYAAAEISFHRFAADSDDVAIRFARTTDQIVIVDGLGANSAGIEAIVLADGTTFTVNDMRLAILASLSTDGNDVIIGTDAGDTLAGGKGSDLLRGGSGDDTYVYRRGDGDDRIEGVGAGADTVRLSDYNAGDIVSAVRAGPDSNDLVVTFSGVGDRIVLINALSSLNSPYSSLALRFADGTVWNRDAMRARVLSDIDSAGNDNAYGFDGADTFVVRAGDDLLSGGEGADLYQFGRGSGHDTIVDPGSSGADRVQLLDFASTEASVEQLYRGSEAIIIRFTGHATASLTVFDALSNDAKGIESYVFSDGVTWTKDTLRTVLGNRAPMALGDGFYSVTTGAEIVLKATDILRNDFDADGDTLTIVDVNAGGTGTATIDAQGNIRYMAANGYYGPATIRYTISDGHNGFATAAIDLRVRPLATAYADSGFTVAEDSSLVIRVERLLANDLDGDRMIVGQVYGAVNGSVSLSSDGNISFTPTANFNGTAEFTYVANTPEGGRAEAKVAIQVTPVNDAPVAHNDSASAIAEGASFTLDPRTLLANDADVDGEWLSIQSVQSNADVIATIGEDGLIHVAPRAYFWGNAYFDYTVVDLSGATSTARVSFTVTPVNDPPELHDDRFDTTDAGDPIREDNPIVIGSDRLLANDIEHDRDPMAVVAVRNSNGGTARLLENGTVLFTPFTDFNGDAWFEYQVDDGQGGTAWARATLVYQPVNDLPVARDDKYTSQALPMLRGFEDTAIEIPIIELLKNDFDPEGFSVRFESVGNAIHGDVQITEHGTIIFTPDADYWGEATFGYLVSDNEGAVDGGTVTLWFENVGDAPPVANRDTIYVNEDIPFVIPIATVLANDTDIDRDPIQFLGWRYATDVDLMRFGGEYTRKVNGIAEFDADGNLVFTPNRDATNSTGIVYRISDGAVGETEGYVDFIIVPSNDDPTVGEDVGFVTPLDAPLVFRVSDLLANDFDVEQADRDGDGIIDDDLDNPKRPRPTFVGIDGVYDADALALGQRNSIGEAAVIDWAGEKFIVVRFAPGFTGNVAVEYRIADTEGATDTGFALAHVAATYGGTLTGSSWPDYIGGTPVADFIKALAGHDYILAGDGNDRIEGGSGNDFIDAGSGDDWIDGGDGADHIDGGLGFDTISFESSDFAVRADLESRVGQGGYAQGDSYLGIEVVIGSHYADQIGGDAGGNLLEGRAGNDFLEGRAGDDTLRGGDGDDVLAGGAGADLLDGGAANDTADYSFGSVGVSISLTTGTAHGGDAEGDVLVDIENLTGTDADDTLEGDAGGNVLSGGRGNDTLIGGAGDDTLIGGRGADQLIGGGGSDIADYTLSAESVTVDMLNGAAGGGDALGDAFTGIEIVQGSHHNDVIRGDDGDNRIRGGRGADVIDGRGGFDIADYSSADGGISVNLGTGLGTAGEAAGDQLASIEMVVGSLWADQLTGSSGDDRFQGLRGNDLIAGGAGSDTYLFGFDDGRDVLVENGASGDLDRLVLSSAIAPKDVSVIRDGNDLLLEFERQDGILVDTVRVTNHFLGSETGIEEVVFANGIVWDRDRLDELQRLGRFNAADDIVRLGFEDKIVVIDPLTLMANDIEVGAGALTLVGVGHAVNATVRFREDGKIDFLGAQDFNGDGYFNYTVRDQFGRESSARVEVNLAPVNDAPTAVNDPMVYVIEDQVLRIRIDSLLANDFDVDGDAELEDLQLIEISPLTNDAGAAIDPFKDSDHRFTATNATANISGDYIEFRLRPDYFGPAGFVYTLRDRSGATSTARAEISVAPVNDAPRDRDTAHWIRLGLDTTITVADLMANTFDIEGDGFTFVGLHDGLDNNPGNNGSVVFDEATGRITFSPWDLGVASIEYDVIDARGAGATLTYHFKVRPLNDPPNANNDYGLRTLEDQILIIDPASLLANDTDENGDTLVIQSIARFADGGKVRLREDGKIEFRPTADYNGAAGFSYTISDGRGGTSSAYVNITVLPRNEGPILRNDLVTGLEDGSFFVIPAEAFGNDVEPDGDVLFFKRSSILGIVDHRFLSADYTVDAAMTDGSPLPSWLHFDPATMRFTGSPPVGMNPVSIDVWISDPANGRVFNTRFWLVEYEIAEGFDAKADVLDGYEIRSPFEVEYEFGATDLDAVTTVTATLANGTELPSWLTFDAATLSFTGRPPEGTTDPIGVRLTFSRPSAAGGDTLTFTDAMMLEPAQLPTGMTYDSHIALFDMKAGMVSASLIGGRPLPDWLIFDAATRVISRSGFEPDTDAQLARLQVVFTPSARTLPNGTYASTDRGFTLEFLVDPHGDLSAQIVAINEALEGDSYFAEQGLFALNLKGAGAITVSRESGAPLPDWLTFDPDTFSFAGSPPPAWIGAIPLRLDIAAGGGHPAMSVITEAVVDDTFEVIGISAKTLLSPEEIRLLVPADFNGTVVLRYDATDEKGGISQKPAFLFYDIKPMRERPDTALDDIAGREGETSRYAVIDLLRNDFDRDRDRLRVLSLGQPTNGKITIDLGHVEIAPPAGLGRAAGAVWTATLADGSALPTWLTIDSATGTLSGNIPLSVLATLDIRVSRTVDGITLSGVLTQRFDGNAGAYVVYKPTGSYSGDDAFSYIVTDDREGPSTGTAVVHVAPLYDPPTTVEDRVTAIEDTPLVIDPKTLLANDFDVDGNPVRFLGVANASYGTVTFDGTNTLFTPDHNFEGEASFEYIVTDDAHGSSTGKVKVTVVSTNRAPIAATDVFATVEDVPLEFTTAQLLGNDRDADGDTITFQSISRTAAGGRILELPDGRWQFVPNENVTGLVSLSYTVSDGRKPTTGTVTFNIAPVNDAPIANPDGAGRANDPLGVFRTKQDQSIVIDFAALIANDRDVEGDTFEIVEIFDADQGTVVRNGSTALFTPHAGYIGDAGFHYRVTDSLGASSAGYVTLLVAPIAPLPIPVSDAGFEMLEDSYLDIDPAALMANDYTPEGTTLTFVAIAGGQLLENGKYRITPEANFNGELVLRYFIKNEQDFAVSTTVTINVLPVADAPVAAPESLRMQEDSPLTLFASQLLANDSDADLQAIVLSRILETSGMTVTDLGFGQLRITPDANYNGAAWFDYEIEDSTGRTAKARVTIDILPVNDAPVIASIPVLKGTEDQRFNATFPATFVSDADGDALLVEVRGKGGVALPSWLQYDALTRTLSGDPPLNFNGALELEVAATDGSAQTIRDLIVSIAPVGDAPVLIAPIDDSEIDEDLPFALSLPTGAFSDPDGGALTLAVTLRDGSVLPNWMSVVAGVLVGTPPANFHGVIELKLTASDGSLSTSADFRFVVRAVNDAPFLMVAAKDRSARGGEALAFNLDGMFGDVDGDTLTITARLTDGAALPTWLVFDKARFTGTPPRDYDGVLDIEVVAADGSLSVSDTFRLTVEPGNAAPAVANPLADVMSPEDTAVLIGIPTGTFTDVDGDELTLSACLADGSALPNWLVFDGVSFTGMPPANFNGVFDIVVTANDGTLAASSSFRLTVAAVNDTPVVAVRLPDVSSPEDEPISFGIPAGSFADVDGDALTLTARMADGSALPDWLAFKDLAFAGMPPGNFNGAIDLEVLASDGVSSTASTFRLTIMPVNDAPFVSTLLPDIVLPRNVQVSIPIAGEIFRDVDGDTLTVTARLSNGNPLPYWLSLSNGRLFGKPPFNLTGVFDIEVSASDGTLTTSDSFRLTIKGTNAQPVVALPLPDVSSPEDTAISLVIPAGSFVDPDGNPLIYTAKLSSGASLPAWLLFDGHTFKGMPPANFNGALDIRVTASDGSLSANDVFRLSITPVNDAPTQVHPLSNVSVREDGPVWFTIPAGAFTDVDNSVLSYSARLADGSALPAWLKLSGTRFMGTPPANFNGVLDIVVTVSDDALTASGNFRLTIVPVNDAPALVTALPDIFSLEDQPVFLTIPAGSFFDVDNDKLTYSAKLLSGAALPAWLSFDGQTFRGTPPTNFNGALDIRVTARDGALSANDVFRLTIAPVNDAPVLVNPLADVTVQEDNAVSITFPYGSFSDVDSMRLTYTATLADGSALPTWLRVGNRSLRGTPPANFNGALDIRVTASDGSLSASGVLRLTITPVNDRPTVATDGPISVVHNEIREIAIVDLLANDVDADGDTLSIVSLGKAATGTVALGADGFVRYTPDFGYQGNDSFTYTVSDGALTATATVSLTVARAFEGWVQGTSAANIMFGRNGVANSLYGASGNDIIHGGDQADRLAGGAGTDTLYGYDGDDEFWGMDGNDTIFGGAGVDTAYFNGLKASYSIVTTDGTVKVKDNQTTVNGNDGVDTLASVERLVFRNGETLTLAAPIVIDLDGAGIETVDAAQSSIMFDIDGDGFADRTSWIGKSEAFLFRDRNRDSVMSGIAEMSFIDEAAEARSDLDGLRSLDSNGDGMISSKDERFGELYLWQDRNADGIVQAGEVFSLTNAGIRSLDLGATAVESNWALGSTVVVNQGTYTRTDGTQMRYADLVLTAVNGSKGAEASAALASLALDRSRTTQTAPDALGQLTASPSGQLQSWASLLGAELSGTATEGHDTQRGGDSARVLALMRQDMSTFGAKSGEGEANWRMAHQLSPMDFCACCKFKPAGAPFGGRRGLSPSSCSGPFYCHAQHVF